MIISQYIGSRRKRDAEKAAAQVFLLGAVFSAAAMAFVFLFGNAVLLALYRDVDPQVMNACRDYLRIVTFSFPACATYNAGAALYRSMGKTRVTMTVSVIMNVANAAGNAVGIFALRAGVAGVAWPTVISWYVAAAMMTARCLRENNDVQLHIRDILHLNGTVSGSILRVALPNAAENMLFQGAKIALGAFVATFGTIQIAANGVAQTLWSLGACIHVAMCPVYITVIGQCAGAKDMEAAAWYMKKLTRLTLVLAIGWSIICTLIALPLLPLYAVSEETRRLIWIAVLIHNSFSAFVEPFTMPLASGLRATGDIRFTFWSSVFCTVFFRTAMAYLLGSRLGMGIIGVTWAMVMDWCLKAALDIMRFRSNRWSAHQLI